MENFNYYKQKEQRLLKAIAVVKSRLKKYSDSTDAQKQTYSDWNDWHDLEYRLQCRLEENYFDFKHEQFKVNGWVAYEV